MFDRPKYMSELHELNSEYCGLQYFQRHPLEVFYKKGVLKNFHKIHRKTRVPDLLS